MVRIQIRSRFFLAHFDSWFCVMFPITIRMFSPISRRKFPNSRGKYFITILWHLNCTVPQQVVFLHFKCWNVLIREPNSEIFPSLRKFLRLYRTAGPVDWKNLPEQPQFTRPTPYRRKRQKKRTIIGLNVQYFYLHDVMKYVKTSPDQNFLSIKVFLQGICCLSPGAESQPYSQLKRATHFPIPCLFSNKEKLCQ